MESIYKYSYAVSCKAVTYKNADNSNCLCNINISCSALLSNAYPLSSNCQVALIFSPHHFINHTSITLDDFDHLTVSTRMNNQYTKTVKGFFLLMQVFQHFQSCSARSHTLTIAIRNCNKSGLLRKKSPTFLYLLS